jgi:hypothetical protein
VRPLSYRDVEAMLIRLGDSTAGIVLVGGQAVNFWAEQYLRRAPELGTHAPYTSKDIDFCGTRAAVVECARRLGGRALLPTDFDPTPNSGQVVFVDDAGAEHIIDFLVQPFGLDAADVLRTSLPVEVLDDTGRPTGARFRVMHPERCLESRVHNVVGLPGYNTPRSLAQLRAAVVCTREFLRDLLAAGHVRPTLDLAERIFRFCQDHPRGRTIYERHGIDPFSAVFPDARLPPPFNEVRYPQMMARLAERRARRAPP